MRLPLPSDHAFAGGPVYPRPKNLISALVMTRSIPEALLMCSVWKQFTRSSIVGRGVKFGLNARLINLSGRERVWIGKNALIRGILRNELGGGIEIGEDVYIGDQALISVAAFLTIGDGTLLAHGVQVFDNDTHPVCAKERTRHLKMIRGDEAPGAVEIGKEPVRIASRCWIGMNSLIMKGVNVGEETIVAAGSVVVSDLPPRVVAAGNPARVIKNLV
jgi:acetyltransferase-like isoleucine patch superfamily enzyme